MTESVVNLVHEGMPVSSLLVHERGLLWLDYIVRFIYRDQDGKVPVIL